MTDDFLLYKITYVTKGGVVMRGIIVLTLFLAVVSAYAAKGDTLATFTLSGQPANGVRGLAYDPTDGNIWAAGPQAANNIIFCKFKNYDDTHAIVTNWVTANSAQYWVFDIGWKYTLSGTDYLVMLDQNAPRIRLIKPSDGSVGGTLTDAFSGGYDEGIEGDYTNGWGTTLYCTNYNFTSVMKWNGTTWASFATCSTPAMGNAMGWNHVFVIHTSTVYAIWVFKCSNGTQDDTITMNNWGTTYMVGLSRGRDNWHGTTSETLYTACFYPSNNIKEIDIGNYNQTEISPTSVGDIKSMFH